NWGDGATTSGDVEDAGGYFAVSGDHKYAREGAYNATVTIEAGEATTIGNASILVFGKPLEGMGNEIDLSDLEEQLASGHDPRRDVLLGQFIDPSGNQMSWMY